MNDLSPVAVLGTLLDIGTEMHNTQRELEQAEHDAVTQRHSADLEFEKAFIRSEGAMDLRRAQAKVETDQVRLDAEVAEAQVRALRSRLRVLQTRADIGRSVNASLKGEAGL